MRFNKSQVNIKLKLQVNGRRLHEASITSLTDAHRCEKLVPFEPAKESGDGVNFVTGMLIFMYWQPFIMQTRFKQEASNPRVRSKTRLK